MRFSLLASTLALTLTTACASDPEAMEPDAPMQIAHAIALETQQAARVIRGQTVQVPVRIVRSGGFTGDVVITAEDLPAGVTAEAVMIAAGETAGTLSLTGGAALALGTYATVTVRASAGELEATGPLDLHLTDPAGALDATFAVGGKRLASFSPEAEELGHKVAVQPDGKLVVAGVDASAKSFFLARFTEAGAADPTFGTGGVVHIPDGMAIVLVRSVTVRADGTILLAARSGYNTLVYAFDASGTLLQGYGNTGVGLTALTQETIGINFSLVTALPTTDGGLVLATYDNDMVVMRLGADGNIVSSFGDGGLARIDFGDSPDVLQGLALHADGRIVVAGYSYLNNLRYAAAQLTVDGKLDTTFSDDGRAVFDTGTDGKFGQVATLPDGRVMLGTGTGGTQSLAMLRADGSLDTSFDGDGFADVGVAAVYGLQPVEDGVLAVVVAQSQAGIAKYRLDGTLDTSFGSAGMALTTMSPANTTTFIGHAMDAQSRVVTVGWTKTSSDPGEVAIARFWQ